MDIKPESVVTSAYKAGQRPIQPAIQDVPLHQLTLIGTQEELEKQWSDYCDQQHLLHSVRELGGTFIRQLDSSGACKVSVIGKTFDPKDWEFKINKTATAPDSKPASSFEEIREQHKPED